jgi:hypothetical protein
MMSGQSKVDNQPALPGSDGASIISVL